MVFCFLMMICLFTGMGDAEEGSRGELIHRTDTATVNWTEGVVSADGSGVPPMASLGGEQEQTSALTEAVSDARAKLMAAISMIPIDAGNSVGDLVKEDPAALSALKEIVAMAEVVHQEFSTDGAREVTIQMSMNGGFSQLVLPKEIEPIKPISTSSDTSVSGEAVSGAGDVIAGPYTGMIVDVRGLPVTPCLAPRILDENGQEVFGPAYASREFAVQYGMSGYVSDMEAAVQHSRVAGSPLVLKGVKVGDDGGNDIIVSNSDAARLRSASENLTLLRQCRVMIVMDDPDAGTEG
jgi:hypothetical protein